MTSAVVGAVLSAAFLGAVITAVVGAIVNSVIARKRFLEEERTRVRATYAEAFEAVAAYKELPYAIRRRRHDQPEAERIRLSEEARQIQQRLSYYRAWTQAESLEVGQAYAVLVAQLRATAGAACNQAWIDAPVRSDVEMNIPSDQVDLRPITAYEDAYITAVASDLKRRKTWRAALPRKT